MATEPRHTNQATHNQEVAQYLNDPTAPHFGDWVITVKFYTALHALRAFLARSGYQRNYKYDQIKEMLSRLGVPSDVRFAFNDFLDLSKKYRYDCQWPNVLAQDLQDADDYFLVIQAFTGVP